MATSTPPALVLFYGNQALSVNAAAEAHIDAVLGKDDPRDFSFQRFDAQEMVRGGGQTEDSPLGAFQMACESAPFLCERWVVRLDRVETIRRRDQAGQNLRRGLETLRLFPVRIDGEAALAAAEDLLATDPREGGVESQRLVSSVASAGGGAPVLMLTPHAMTARFLLSQGAKRRLVDGPTFLKSKLKGKFTLSAPGASDAAGAEAFGSETSGAPAERLHAILERLIGTPPAGLHLVLTGGASRDSDLSRPLLTQLKKAGRIEKFITYDDYNPVDWVLKEAASRHLKLHRGLAEILIHLVGNDLGRLSGELDKLSLLFAEGETPNETAFIAAMSGGQGGSLFLISERLGQRDLEGALGILEHFLAETPGAHPLLLGILSKHVRQMLHLHDLMRLGVPEGEWASRIKLHPFLAKRVVAQARRFKTLELEGILRALAVLDRQLKLHSHLTAPLLREFFHGACLGAYTRPGAGLLKLPGVLG